MGTDKAVDDALFGDECGAGHFQFMCSCCSCIAVFCPFFCDVALWVCADGFAFEACVELADELGDTAGDGSAFCIVACLRGFQINAIV